MIYGFVFRRYAPFDTFGFGYEGDARSAATTNLAATARTIGALNFTPGIVGNMFGESSGTNVSGYGETIKRLLGTHKSVVTSSVNVATKSIDCLRFTAHTAGSNPMSPAPALVTPDIDTFVDVHVVFRSRSLEISGKMRGDNFPNGEIFATDATGKAIMLFEFATTGGQNSGPFTRLFGSHSNQLLGEFSKRIPIDATGAFA